MRSRWVVGVVLVAMVVGCGPSIEQQKKMIHMAAKAGDAVQTSDLLKRNPSLVSDSDPSDNGRTPLHQAANADVARVLIDNGANLQATDQLGFTPLHTAVDVGVAELLFNKDVDVNVVGGEFKLTPTHTASTPDVLRFLVSHGGKLWVEKGLTSPLSYAIQNSPVNVIEAMIDLGADVRYTDFQGRTYLHAAVQRGKKAAAEALINKGFDVNATDRASATPLHYAALAGDVEMAKMLLDHGANVHAKLSAGAAIADQNQRIGGVRYDKSSGGATPIKVAESAPMKDLLKQYGAAE